ncbi:hypothetical protein MCETHM1_03527 [Flavobacteriaceae bacterium]
MKKTLVILALTIISYANAQKGTYLVSGNFTYYSLKSDNETLYNFWGFSPKIGYQFKDNWTAGVVASISTAKNGGASYENKTNAYSIGGFLRYSKPLGNLFVFYTDLSSGYNNSKMTNSYYGGNNPPNTNNTGDGFHVGILPAISLNISNGYALNFNIGGIDYSRMNYDDGTYMESTSITIGQAFSAGISKNF